MRGLKRRIGADIRARLWSHPSRVRGLKLFKLGMKRPRDPVAPFTGAWIETEFVAMDKPDDESHPSRVRGLKQQSGDGPPVPQRVAPFTGAWIETRGAALIMM